MSCLHSVLNLVLFTAREATRIPLSFDSWHENIVVTLSLFLLLFTVVTFLASDACNFAPNKGIKYFSYITKYLGKNFIQH